MQLEYTLQIFFHKIRCSNVNYPWNSTTLTRHILIRVYLMSIHYFHQCFPTFHGQSSKTTIIYSGEGCAYAMSVCA